MAAKNITVHKKKNENNLSDMFTNIMIESRRRLLPEKFIY